MNTELLLKKAVENVEAGARHQAAGRVARTRLHYLQAADFLFKAASRSGGEIGLLRTRKAEQLLELAKNLASTPESSADRPQGQFPSVAAEDATVSQVPGLVMERPSVRFADVAGLDDVRQEIHLKLLYPIQFPDKAAQYRLPAGGGILLYGPPGTGKTLIARAVAGEVDAAFYHVKPSDIMSKWVGEAERNIAKLFDSARGQPRSVIFIDEIEALVPRRRDSSSTVMKRVVPQILAELEGFDKKPKCLLFIGATNEPWELDPAVLRPGRFDEKIYVPLPDASARLRILDLQLAGRPVAADVELRSLSDMLEGFSGADIGGICVKATQKVFLDSIQTGVDRPIRQSDFHEAIHNTKRSVSGKELVRYLAFAEIH